MIAVIIKAVQIPVNPTTRNPPSLFSLSSAVIIATRIKMAVKNCIVGQDKGF